MAVENFIWGLVITIVGFIIVWKTEWLLRNFGRIDWAEQHLSNDGGSRLMYRLIGTLIIIIGLLFVTNLIEGLLLDFAGLIY